MNKIVEDEGLKDTYPYVDNVIIGGMDDAEHDANEARFLEVAKKRNLTFNDSKTIRKVPQIPTLGYVVGNGVVKPDPDRLRALQEMPPPHNTESLNRVRGMFAYYAKWIPQFSQKIQPLVKSTEFPLSREAHDSFHSLKEELVIYNHALVYPVKKKNFNSSFNKEYDHPMAFDTHYIINSTLCKVFKGVQMFF